MSPVSILASALPIYLIMLTGGVARRLGWMPREADAGIIQLVVRLLFPCLVLERIVGNEALKHPSQVFLAAGLGFAMCALSVVLCYGAARLIGLDKGAGARTFGLSAGFQNYGYLAIPVAEAIFDRNVVGVLFTFTLGVELALWVVGVGILTGMGRAPWKHVINAPVLSIILALVLHYCGAAPYIPEVGHDFLKMLGGSAIPVVLLLIGGSISDLIGVERFQWKVAITSVIMRLVVLQVAFLLVAWVVPMSDDLRRVIVVQAAMPSAVFTIVVAKHYGGHPPTAVLVVLATSIVSLFTVPFAIGWAVRWLGL